MDEKEDERPATDENGRLLFRAKKTKRKASSDAKGEDADKKLKKKKKKKTGVVKLSFEDDE